MTISSVQLPLYFHDTYSPTAGQGKGGVREHGSASMARGSEAQTGAAVSRPASDHEMQAGVPIVRGMDVGFLLQARQDLQTQGAAFATSRGAYADAAALIGADAQASLAVHHSEADYALNP